MSDTNPASVQADKARIEARLRELPEEHHKMAVELARAKSTYRKAVRTAYVLSVAKHRDRKVGEHEAHADLAAIDEYTSMVMCEERDKALRYESYELRDVLASLVSTDVSLRAVT